MKHAHHARHVVSYPKSLPQRIYVLVIAPLFFVGLLAVGLSVFHIGPSHDGSITLHTLLLASGSTLVRLVAAYVLALALAIPLALLTTSSPLLESILLPLFDVLDSIPILAFFPVVILLFIQAHFLEGAAVFILFVNILWNIVFTVVGGLKIIPTDITYAARIFGLTGMSYFRRMILPAIFPQLVTGSILALAEGWNLIIVAEALHSYMPSGSESQDLFGIGSILVHAASSGQNNVFISALIVMVLLIAAINLLIWQRLLHISQRFRFD